MSGEYRRELRADPGTAPDGRGIEVRPRRSIWPSIAVVAAAAAFGGVIWFAYQNGKDANRSGPPPLVKADPSPVKIKPTDPGGQEIPFQDSTVYDRLDQKGQKPVMEKLLPPAEEPVTRPPAQTQIQGQTQIQPQNQSQPQASASPGDQAALPPPPADTTSPIALAPLPGAVIITQPPAPTPRVAQTITAAPATITTPPKAAAPAKPIAPPPAATAAPTSIAALESRALAQMASKSAGGSGAYRIQISAVKTPDAVAPEWARLKHRYPDILGALSVISSKMNVAGKGDFYRLRAGPLDEAAAKSACGHLRAQGLGCVVVKP